MLVFFFFSEEQILQPVSPRCHSRLAQLTSIGRATAIQLSIKTSEERFYISTLILNSPWCLKNATRCWKERVPWTSSILIVPITMRIYQEAYSCILHAFFLHSSCILFARQRAQIDTNGTDFNDKEMFTKAFEKCSIQ